MEATATNNTYAAPSAELEFESDAQTAKLFTLQGRMGVLKYAAQSLLWMVVFGLLTVAAFAVTGGMSSMTGEGPSPILLGMIGLIALPGIFLMLCLLSKRLHDLNMSAWFALVMIIPVVGSFFGLYAMFWPGKADANRFGAAAETKTWEKVVGGLYIALMVVGVAAGIFAVVSASF